MVAEKRSDWRLGGSVVMMRFTSWTKPMSSMRSASSRTKTSTLSRKTCLLLLEVLEAAGRGDEDVDAAQECLHLRMLADAAEDDGVLQVQMAAVMREALADLRGELARGREDKRARALRDGRRGMRGELLQNRQRERGGLARAGLRDAEEVAALQQVRDGAGLDGRGDGVVLVEERALERLNERSEAKVIVVAGAAGTGACGAGW